MVKRSGSDEKDKQMKYKMYLANQTSENKNLYNYARNKSKNLSRKLDQ